MFSTKQSTAAGEAGARGARAAPPVASDCVGEIVHATAPGRPATGTIVLGRAYPMTFAQITSVSNTRMCTVDYTVI